MELIGLVLTPARFSHQIGQVADVKMKGGSKFLRQLVEGKIDECNLNFETLVSITSQACASIHSNNRLVFGARQPAKSMFICRQLVCPLFH